MLRLILGYTSFEPDVQFLQFKQAYIHDRYWMAAFYIHVFTAIVALAAGFSQFSADFLKEHRALHRRIGKFYVFSILCINAPVGLILAIDANGGLWGKTAFVLLDCLWFYFTCAAFIFARRRDIASHKRFMIRSYALTCTALTLRSWKLILSNSFQIDPQTLYVLDAWLGFVPNLIVAEWIIRRNTRA